VFVVGMRGCHAAALWFLGVGGAWVVERSRRLVLAGAGVAQVFGVFSGFFVNAGMCLVVTPRVLEITGGLRSNPIFICSPWPWPPLSAVWPPTGDLQPTRIGRLWHIASASLVARLAPVATVSLVLTILVMR
jgi:Na+/H+ antiporter NhaD/arsenite permease-like protein